LQVKLCDPCLSAFEALCVKMRYTNRRILYFTYTSQVSDVVDQLCGRKQRKVSKVKPIREKDASQRRTNNGGVHNEK